MDDCEELNGQIFQWLASAFHTPGFLTPQQYSQVALLCSNANLDDWNWLKTSFFTQDFLSINQLNALLLQICGDETDGTYFILICSMNLLIECVFCYFQSRINSRLKYSRFLLEQGAEWICRDHLHRLPFHRCISFDRVASATYLIHRYPHAPNMSLCEGNEEALRWCSPLSIAIAVTKSHEMVELLLRNGATASSGDLFLAVEHGNVALVRMLVELGSGNRSTEM